MDEDEGEDSNFLSCIVLLIIVLVLFLLFRNQIEAIFIGLLNSVQDIIQLNNSSIEER